VNAHVKHEPLRSGFVFSVWLAAGREFEKPSKETIKRIKCPDSLKHNSGDAMPSARLNGPKNYLYCDGCGLKLSAKELAEFIGVDWKKLLDDERGYIPEKFKPAPPSAPIYAPRGEIEALWGASHPVNRTIVEPNVLDVAVCFFMSRRRLYPPAIAALDVARVTPLPDAYEWPAWWPRRWARDWRLIVRAYTAAGTFAGIHGRAITPEVKPKTRWPLGVAAAGLLFGDTRAANLLRGKVDDTDRVIVVEGLTDLLSMALIVADAGRKHAVLGVSAVSTSALTKIVWPMLPVVIATDADTPGDDYARAVRAAIPSTIDVRRWRPSDRKVVTR